jgi:predicted kinase
MATGRRFHGLWLDAPREVLEARVAVRRNDASDATVEVLNRQLDGIDRTSIDWTKVDVSGDPASALANAAGAIRTSG